jgi:uncharacterized protein YjcR
MYVMEATMTEHDERRAKEIYMDVTVLKMGVRAVARKYGVSPSLVSRIASGQRWSFQRESWLTKFAHLLGMR